MTKLPEPMELSSPADERSVYGYTEAQMLQFRSDALDEAIDRIKMLREDWGDPAEESGMSSAIYVIRKLKETK
jgi:hypothetical protein